MILTKYIVCREGKRKRFFPSINTYVQQLQISFFQVAYRRIQNVDGHNFPRHRLSLSLANKRSVGVSASPGRRVLALRLWRGNSNTIHEEPSQSRFVLLGGIVMRGGEKFHEI